MGELTGLSTGQPESDRLAQAVCQQVNLGAQSTSGTPQSLVFAPFLRPVAACWWARTIVESSIRYGFFRSATRSSNSRSHTPASAQRRKRLCTLLYLP